MQSLQTVSGSFQYFDKSRMEITFPDGDRSSPFYVTNGLLVVELISGRLQTGDNSFEDRSPAIVNVAGDATDPDGPTYASFSNLLDTPPLPFDRPIVQTISPRRRGRVSTMPLRLKMSRSPSSTT